MRVKQVVSDYLTAKRALTTKTKRWYTQKLAVFTDWCEREHIELEHVNARTARKFLDQLDPHLSSYTRKGYTQVVKGFLSWCSQEEDLEHLVSAKTATRIELPKVEKTVISTYTKEDIDALFRACQREASRSLRVRDGAILSVLFDTGVRASELAYDSTRPNEITGLRMEHVFLDGAASYIRVMGKGRKERDIGLGHNSVQALRLYISRHRGKSSSPYVFLSRSGEPLTVRGLEELIYRLGAWAGINDAFVHRCRHSFAVMFLLNGGDVYTLMRIMGHTNINTTRIYLDAMTNAQVRKSPSVLDSLK